MTCFEPKFNENPPIITGAISKTPKYDSVYRSNEKAIKPSRIIAIPVFLKNDIIERIRTTNIKIYVTKDMIIPSKLPWYKLVMKFKKRPIKK